MFEKIDYKMKSSVFKDIKWKKKVPNVNSM